MSSILGDPNHSPKLPIQTLFTETRESPDPIMAHEIAKNVKGKEKQYARRLENFDEKRNQLVLYRLLEQLGHIYPRPLRLKWLFPYVLMYPNQVAGLRARSISSKDRPFVSTTLPSMYKTARRQTAEKPKYTELMPNLFTTLKK